MNRVTQFSRACKAVTRKKRHFERAGANALAVRFPLDPTAEIAHLMAVHRRCADCCFKGRTGPAAPCAETTIVQAAPSNDNEAIPVILNGIDFAYGLHTAVRPGLQDYARIGESIVLAFALVDNDEQPACACSEALFARVSPDHWGVVSELRQPEVR